MAVASATRSGTDRLEDAGVACPLESLRRGDGVTDAVCGTPPPRGVRRSAGGTRPPPRRWRSSIPRRCRHGLSPSQGPSGAPVTAPHTSPRRPIPPPNADASFSATSSSTPRRGAKALKIRLGARVAVGESLHGNVNLHGHRNAFLSTERLVPATASHAVLQLPVARFHEFLAVLHS